jgi:hypothetical protein
VEREWHAQDELVVQRCEDGEEGVGCVLCKWHVLPFKFNDAGRGWVKVTVGCLSGVSMLLACVLKWPM